MTSKPFGHAPESKSSKDHLNLSSKTFHVQLNTIELDGQSLSIEHVNAVAKGASISIAELAIDRVKIARLSVEEAVESGEVIYGINTGFGSNADVILDDLNAAENLQKNLILTHAVCVGKPLAQELVRALMVIRINTLLKGHSGIRWALIERLMEMLNFDLIPVIPEKGSVGASGDLAPLSHMTLPLIGAGEVIYQDQRMSSVAGLALLPSTQSLPKEKRAFKLSYKEGLALINGTTLMTAYGALIVGRLQDLIDLADCNGALAVEAICGRSAAFRKDVHDLRPHQGQIKSAAHLRFILRGSTLVDIDAELVPNHEGTWRMVTKNQEHKLQGGKATKPQDSYSIRCIPQVHGAIRDALEQAHRIVSIELNSVTDNPLIFPSLDLKQRFASAGHFHGMPIALALSYLKVSIPSLASIAERRLNKLLDPATNDGLPAFLIPNRDGSESGLMIVQYTAAALVNDLASRAHPTTVYSVPTSANTEDHVSMGANEGRHVYEMLHDLGRVLALELMTNAQAVELRLSIFNGQYDITSRQQHSLETQAQYEKMKALDPKPSQISSQLIQQVRTLVPYLAEDRALSPDLDRICEAVLKSPDMFTSILQATE